jgi:hypothetical protein
MGAARFRIVVGLMHAVLKIPRVNRGAPPSTSKAWDGLPPILKGQDEYSGAAQHRGRQTDSARYIVVADGPGR